MKNLIKYTIAFAVLFTTTIANANTSFKFVNDAKTTTLKLSDVKPGNQLVIKNDYGIVIYKETIKNSGAYNKGFDLTDLPSGDYFFELNKDSEIKIIPFNVTNQTVSFNKEEEETIFKPIVTNKENRVYISKLSLQLKPTEIRVYYENPEGTFFKLIYSEVFTNSKVISRVLNLDKTIKGRYKIVTKTEGRMFVDYIQF